MFTVLILFKNATARYLEEISFFIYEKNTQIIRFYLNNGTYYSFNLNGIYKFEVANIANFPRKQ